MGADTVLQDTSTARGMAGRFYRPELDVLRFVAFSMVFVTHSMPATSHFLFALKQVGALGVPVFFLLSAYLITELLFRERETTGSVNLRAFYIRRILRIWPIYFFVLFLGFLVSRFIVGANFSRGTLAAYLLLAGNWNMVLHGPLPLGLAVLWSIGIEEQFYLLWPSLLARTSRRTLLQVAAAIWIFCQMILLWLCNRHLIINPGIWANSFSQMQYFVLGAAISILLKGTTLNISAVARALFAVIAFLIFFIANFFFNTVMDGRSSISQTYFGYLITGFGAVLLFLSLLGSSVPKLLKPVVFLGKISYGLYVLHYCCLLLSIEIGRKIFPHNHHLLPFRFLIGLPMTLFVAMISYRYFETPFLRLKERFEIVKSRAI